MKKLTHIISIFILIICFANCKKETAPPPVTTSLRISVTDNSGNAASGAAVKLYTSFTDWENKTNEVGTQSTDGSGNVVFDNLTDIKYYFFASKDCLNNGFKSVSTAGPIASGIQNNASTNIDQAGAIVLKNVSSSIYGIYVNGTYWFDLPGGATQTLPYKPVGFYSIRVKKTSGIANEQTFTGNLTCGGSLTTTFPQ